MKGALKKRIILTIKLHGADGISENGLVETQDGSRDTFKQRAAATSIVEHDQPQLSNSHGRFEIIS